MNDSTCPRPCLMKLDLQSSTNKLAFLKDNWPSFGQIESIDRLSETELRCIRRRGISVFYGAILCMLSLFSSFRKEENRDTTDF